MICRMLFSILLLLSSLMSAQEAPSAAPAAPSQSATPEAPGASQATQSLPDSVKVEAIKVEKAIYPVEAQQKGIQGQVWLLLYVSETGDVDKVDVISGDPALVPAAVEAAKKWKYKPFIRNGKPIRVKTKIPFDFATNSASTDTNTASADQPTEIAETVSAGLLARRFPPVYPSDAQAFRIQGVVVLKVRISKSGDVSNVQLVSGHPMLAPAAIRAVKQWKYKPYLLNGEPVEVTTQVRVAFHLM